MMLPRLKSCLLFALSVLALCATALRAQADLPDPVRFGVVVELGDIRTVRGWLDEGLPPDFMADRIGSGLMIAAWEGNIPMMELFLKYGADINKTNDVKEQALMHAAWKGRAEAVRWLLDRGATINRSGLEWSPLHYAVFGGHGAVAQLLLDRGADINARSTNGSSVLMMAAREGHEKLAHMLLEHGADTTIVNDRGEDALAWAMRNDHPRIAKMVSSPEQFAVAARKTYEPPTRSLPVPDRIEALFWEMRAAEAQGRMSESMRQAYDAAIGELEKTRRAEVAAQASRAQATPKALEITAKRGAPGQEKAMLIYERGSVDAQPPKPAPKPASKTAAKPAAKPTAKTTKSTASKDSSGQR